MAGLSFGHSQTWLIISAKKGNSFLKISFLFEKISECVGLYQLVFVWESFWMCWFISTYKVKFCLHFGCFRRFFSSHHFGFFFFFGLFCCFVLFCFVFVFLHFCWMDGLFVGLFGVWFLWYGGGLLFILGELIRLAKNQIQNVFFNVFDWAFCI